MRGSRLAALAGIVGAAIWIGLAFFPPDWGEPGTDSYHRYQTWNRIWAAALILMAIGVAGGARSNLPARSRSARWGLVVFTFALLVMAAGNAAEFWLFTDLPYDGGSDAPNARSLAWMTFLLGWLGALIAGMVAGLALLRTGGRAVAGWPLALVLVLTIGIGAAATLSYAGIPLAAAVIGIAIALLLDRGEPVPA